MDYTLEVYISDHRFKAKEHMINKLDLTNVTLEEVNEQIVRRYREDPRYRFVINETYKIRKNLLSGQEFKDRYDTP